jgi:peptidoglycan glycosyltransferase
MRRFILWLLLALFVVGALAAIAIMPARRAADSWRAHRVAEAIEEATWWSRFRLWPNQYHQVLAASHLSVGNRAGADRHLNAMRGKRLLVSLISKNDVAARLFARSRYDDFLAYDAASRPLLGDRDSNLFRAAAFVATNRIAEAESALRTLDADDADATKVAALNTALAARKQGSYPYVVDKSGRTIALYEITNRDVVALNADFASLVEREAGAHTIEANLTRFNTNDVIETTLDPAIQKAALAALGGFRGALVAIDPRDNSILAAASSRGGGSLANLALEEQYEPGSVIKVLTALNAAASNVSVPFPYQCNGELQIDDRRLPDWLAGGHGALPDVEQAMAESCNIVFADLGIRLGVDRLRAFMTTAGFDGQADLGLFTVPLGKTIGPILNRYETGLYAIGLEHETATALHLAMIAAALANRGVMTQPHLLRARRSILGDSAVFAKRAGSPIVSRDIAESAIRTMVAAATREKATGRRAAPEGVSLAMKTGTAGSAKGGLSSIIIAFTPVENPVIAFALIAEDAGPAEYAGAKITHDFLLGVRGSL